MAVSGKLWNRSLVMVDQETGSLWSHLLGRAMSGAMEGTNLKTLPGLMTDWKTWRQMHPKTTVVTLSRTSTDYRREFYQRPQRFVVGIADGDAARAWPFDQLLKQPVVNDSFEGKPLVVVFDEQSKTAFLFDRRVEQNAVELTLRDGQLLDEQSGAMWNARTGRAISTGEGSDEAEVADLTPIPGIVSFRHTWEVFHPKSTTFRAN